MSQNFEKYFIKAIEDLKNENRYREFVNIARICKEFPFAINQKNGKKIVVWCSNDYLGMGQNPQAILQAKKALEDYGIGSGGTRNISGNNSPILDLEKTVANLHKKQSGLVFSSGYVANDGAIQALVKIIPDLIIFSDAKNHASIIAGVKNSGAKKHVFRHNDLNHLEELLKNYDLSQPKLIIFESVYSMDGDFGKIAEIVAIAKKYQALTYIDEVHAVGLYGETGAGLTEQLAMQNHIDIIQGTFAKGFGSVGGYITSSQIIIDAIRSYASPFIFSTSMPPSIAVACKANIEHLIKSKIEREKLFANVAEVKKRLLENKINIFENSSHIISVRIGDAKKAKIISQKLLENFDIYVQHINYPTVAKGDERLRITPSALHNQKMIDDLILALTQIIKEVL
jgi:5-aminolevulinate synthase